MIIDIDDSISGEERKRILRLGPVKYALDLFDGNREKTSKWLNISDRTLRNYIIELPCPKGHGFSFHRD